MTKISYWHEYNRGKKFLKYGNTKIELENQKFHSSKNPMTIGNVNIDKMFISDKFACGKGV